MAVPPRPSIREVILTEIVAQTPQDQFGPALNQTSVLNAAARRVGITQNPELEQAILTQWSELFRTGLLAWGLNLSNPSPPFFHLTERGRQALENVTRDPSNPGGYLRHLSSMGRIDSVVLSYLREALDCYVAGLFKAAAVMVGGAAEKTVLDLRDAVTQKLASLGRTIPTQLGDWRIKVVSDALRTFLDANKAQFGRELRDSFEAAWGAVVQQIRSTRNDVGHPTSIDPVTPDTVHASLLVFPELVKLTAGLETWVTNNLS
jgi:hypothetical protein